MLFFHGTTKEKFELIKKEGILFGGDSWHRTKGKEGYRYTYLTPELEVAQQHIAEEKDGIILEVEYDPVGVGTGVDNYVKGCWQFSVFKPIDISCVTKGDKGGSTYGYCTENQKRP